MTKLSNNVTDLLKSLIMTIAATKGYGFVKKERKIHF